MECGAPRSTSGRPSCIGIEGEPLSMSGAPRARVEACFTEALEVGLVGRRPVLRAAGSHRVSPVSGPTKASAPSAHDLLAPVYHWFVEGFDTAGLKEAKAPLDELK